VPSARALSPPVQTVASSSQSSNFEVHHFAAICPFPFNLLSQLNPEMADINSVAKQFTDFYYTTFDTNRSGLQNLYRDHSMLSWEGTPIVGAANISEKLTTLPFEKVQHKITTLDAQPSSPTVASLIVSVTGLLLVDDSTNPLQFSQIFQLVPDGSSYYVYNDIFRLNYGA